MKGIVAILLLVVSNVFMTLAWYGQLRFRFFQGFSLWGVVLVSWGIALLEYCFMIPANRIGFEGTGGPFSLLQLKVIQEVLSLLVFALFTTLFFKTEVLRLNHLYGAVFLVLAVYFMFKK
ncbi:MAG: DMT family protein [Rikenella sp.]|nr:DMT family protein [Rikenella sp.]